MPYFMPSIDKITVLIDKQQVDLFGSGGIIAVDTERFLCGTRTTEMDFFFHVHVGPPIGLLTSGFQNKILFSSLLSHVCYIRNSWYPP
jgi:hypothetical protein